MRDFIIKRCSKCGTVVKMLKDCSNTLTCCNEKMETLIPNSVDAAIEKHVPTYEVKDGKIFVKVNHVMEEDHYIEWIDIAFGEKDVTTYLAPGKNAIAHCKYVPGSLIYSYCNKHGLWKIDVK